MIEIDNLKKALEADSWCSECGQEHLRPAIEQLIKALAEQPKQELVAWIDHKDGLKTVVWKEWDYPAIGTKLYTHPKQWQGLSDDEIIPMYNEPSSDAEMIEFACAIEAKLKELNT
jgi:hypothetical protein